jgi:riboflavin synthase
MFTGIVQETGKVVSVPAGRLVIAAGPAMRGLEPGGSIAVNGVCLTATGVAAGSFTVDVMPETLRRTNLGGLRPGDRVNLERPLGLGGELGGHLVQGHIDGTGRVASVIREGEALLMRFTAPSEIMPLVVDKGFVAVDGTSLTVVEKGIDSFTVSIVGFTLQHTILADRKVGDSVNLEADITGKYVASFLGSTEPQNKGVTAEFLREHGFLVN